MRAFASLYQALDRSTGTLDKRAALKDYFTQAPPADAAWGLWLLSGGKLSSRIANARELRDWAAADSDLPPWLVQECYEHVGDLAETLALLIQQRGEAGADASLAEWIERRLLPLNGQDEALRRETVIQAWHALPDDERLVFNKLLTGALRIGVSKRLVQQALAEQSGVPIALIAQRMLGDWTPSAAFMRRLLVAEALPEDRQQPYPFFLASALPGDATALGPIEDWLLEWKWDGIRLQLIHRDGGIALWSRGEERLDGRFPEIEAAAAGLDAGWVIDGELLAWRDGDARPLPFTALQKRIQRIKPSAKLIADTPTRVVAYDLLEFDGEDWRDRPLRQRRERLAQLLRGDPHGRIVLSEEVAAADWDAAARLRLDARARGVEGLMLKRADSAYQAGRRRGDWWKWKIDPLTVDAVLLYAQSGSGRRSTLFTDYTFGLWDGDALVPVAKAYSGLDDAQIATLDQWIRAHTVERFGPVRAVEPVHVFELGFEGVNRSARHKSGVAVRFPRILRWRHDKPAAQADRLEVLRDLAQ